MAFTNANPDDNVTIKLGTLAALLLAVAHLMSRLQSAQVSSEQKDAEIASLHGTLAEEDTDLASFKAQVATLETDANGNKLPDDMAANVQSIIDADVVTSQPVSTPPPVDPPAATDTPVTTPRDSEQQFDYDLGVKLAQNGGTLPGNANADATAGFNSVPPSAPVALSTPPVAGLTPSNPPFTSGMATPGVGGPSIPPPAEASPGGALVGSGIVSAPPVPVDTGTATPVPTPAGVIPSPSVNTGSDMLGTVDDGSGRTVPPATDTPPPATPSTATGVLPGEAASVAATHNAALDTKTAAAGDAAPQGSDTTPVQS